MLSELTALNERLERQMEQGDITAYQFYVILEMAKVVSDALAADKPKVKEGVDRIMGGKVLEHRAKDIKIEQQKEDAKAMYADGIEPERIARILKIQLADVEKMLNLQPQMA